MIKIYNTLTRQKEEFRPIESGKVSMYVCGPTVYNYIHIGNARSVVAFDTIRRYLEYRGYQVHYVSNFTDVDDKIIKAAKERNWTPKQVADFFIEAFFEDVTALNVKKADHHPRVMDNIQDIIDFVANLIDQGFAYEADGDVYFRTRKFEDYGKLSRISLDELRAGASERLEEDEQEHKEDPVDFALWKKAKPGEIYWKSPWSDGRPGWHIECSVMATKYLGETIDIHGGGQDLTFPHHENEIAQSEAHSHAPFVHYWMHNGFVTMGGDKMSKSLGNFKLLKDLRKEIDPLALRFFLSTAHYRHPIVFSEEAIHDADVQLSRVKTALFNAEYRLNSAVASLEDDDKQLASWQKFEKEFRQYMDDDFQAQNAISVVYEMIRVLNRYLERERVSRPIVETYMKDIQTLLSIFGLENLLQTASDLEEGIDDLIQEREEAREQKDFARADAIRDELKAQGIILEDTPQGVRWKRVDQQ